MASCLGDDVVLGFVEDSLTPAERADVNKHMTGCADCRKLVAAAARSYFSAEASTLGESVRGPSPELAALSALDHVAHVGRYQVLGPIGVGGMGVVYAAHDPQLDRKIALKLMRADAEKSTDSQARLLREAQAMARVAHPNVVAVHDAGTFDGQVFLAMELVKGKTLAQWLRDEPRTWRAVVEQFLHAGRGLAAAHAAGIVHRDFKPQNVLFGVDGRIRVTDFGLARASDAVAPTEKLDPALLSSTMTKTGTVVGTPAYMAPEQFRGEPTSHRTDQFSFCVAVYEAIYGQRPFAPEGKDWKVRPAPADRNVPEWMRDVLLRGLSENPEKRFPDMGALLDALTPPAEGVEPPKLRKKPWAGIAAAGAIALAAVVAVLAWPAAEVPAAPAPVPIPALAPVVVAEPPAPPPAAVAEPPAPAPVVAVKPKPAVKKPTRARKVAAKAAPPQPVDDAALKPFHAD